MLGSRLPSTKMAVPMPVPKVSMMTTPSRRLPAPKAISANPAASASLSTRTGQPVVRSKRVTASTPIQESSTLAAVRTVRWWTMAGKVQPMAPRHSKCRASCPTTSATASGSEGSGVGMRWRGPASSPVARSTGAPLMPLPPMSMPRTFIVTLLSAWIERLCLVPQWGQSTAEGGDWQAGENRDGTADDGWGIGALCCGKGHWGG